MKILNWIKSKFNNEPAPIQLEEATKEAPKVTRLRTAQQTETYKRKGVLHQLIHVYKEVLVPPAYNKAGELIRGSHIYWRFSHTKRIVHA